MAYIGPNCVCVEMGGVSFLWGLEKVLKSVHGQGWRVGVCGFPLLWERVQAVEVMLWPQYITGVPRPCPFVFPIKKDLPLRGCLPKIPLHLSLFIYPTSCLSILFPMFCSCFSFDSCSACNRRDLWVPSVQTMAYP